MHLRTHRLFCCAGAVDLRIGRFFPCVNQFFLACALVLIVHAMLAVHADATSTYIYHYFLYMLYAYAQGQSVVFAVRIDNLFLQLPGCFGLLADADRACHACCACACYK